MPSTPATVVDTSVLQYLHQLGCLDLLQRCFGAVLVPADVAAELEEGRSAGVDLPVLGDRAWLSVVAVDCPPAVLAVPGLHRGEQAVLALALATRARVIVDDRAAGRHAQRMGLTVTGTLGVFLRAKQEGLLEAVAPAVARLVELGFHLDEATRATVMELAGEA